MIEILIATYNGEKYINDQIESIFNQTCTDWKLIFRDDCSTDNTMKILERYEEKYPEKVKILRDEKGGLGAKGNFFELLKKSTSDYVMFCDQDDIWLPNKIKITLKKMQEVENGPTLIHTDLKVVDEKLNIKADSMWKFQKTSPQRTQYNYLIVQDNITGCTVMINKELANYCKGDFPNALMHDWVVGIIACLKGKIDYVEESTILYRQHGNNAVGAQGYYKNFFRKLKKIKTLKSNIYQINFQLKDILRNIDIDDNDLKKILEEFIELPNKNYFYRKIWLLKNKFLKQGLLQKIGHFTLY